MEHLSAEPGYGPWLAWSVSSATHFPRRYEVHIRSLVRRANYCGCPDFAVNQLGTCKHIEAVLHKLQKQRNFNGLKMQAPPHPYIYLDWEGEEAPGVRLHRAEDAANPELSRLLDNHFDDAGGFRLRMPEDFLRLAGLLEGQEAIDIGADALAYARRLAGQAAHELQAERIRARIQATGGHIPGVRARLYPYQMEGVAFLAANSRALLADDMGLGKTLQAIAASVWLRDNAGAERVLIVCPASLKHQWAREVERFTDAPVQIVQGNAEARGVQYRRGAVFTILNYELVLRDLSLIGETLRPDLLILDEAQRIKNWRTKIASAVKQIPSRYAFVLSGTPLENRLEDLYSLMQVVDPHVLGPLWRYRVDFHVTDDKGKVLGYRNLSELRRRLKRVMLRRDRRLVRDQLPDRITQRIDVELTEAQWELHNAALTAAGNIARIAKRRPLTPGEQNRMMSALQTARMACDAAGLVDKETQGSPKLDELSNLLDELCVQSGLKAVIFSQWELMTQMAEARARALGLGCVRLHGGIPTDKRGALMDRFRDDDAVQVFISTDAGATGLNLQNASVLINLDIPWNPAVLEQRNARIHRLGQRNKVQIILLVAAGAYEESVLYMVEGKRNLFDNVVEGDATEDVVGVSKRLVEVLVADLNKEEAAASPVESPRPPDGIDRDRIARRWKGERAEAVRGVIVALQQGFGCRIERILGAGGGLLVVLDRVGEEDERTADGLSDAVPVALIDPRTLKGLGRLGAGSPVAEADTLFEAAPPVEVEPPLLRQAREKIRAADLLIQQNCLGPAVELLIGGLLAAAASLAGETAPPEPQRAGVWLYGEILPRGLLDQGQAALLARALALAQSGGDLPEAMVRELAGDAAGFVGRCTAFP
ncbi:MAG: helicase [Gammaproteobacteria bacterium RIFOXYA12_FULL_61_12]|nr:MAG: helicase [Gammaproteobacteria bacterium RIFOXYA12_FULL_61_12]